MNNKFKLFVESLLKEGSDDYSTEIKASIFLNLPEDQHQKYDYDSFQKLNISFSLDMEARSWGIKSISLALRHIESFVVELTDMSTGQVVSTINVQIDPSKLQIEKEAPTNYIGFGDMDIYIDENGAVDYTRSSIQSFAI